MDTNTVQVIESFGNKLDSYIQALADKAGVAADHFYPVFVRQQVIEGYTCLAGALFAVIAIVVLLRMGFKYLPAANSDESADVVGPAIVKSVVGFVGGAILLIGMVASSGHISQAIGKVANPEYTAVRALVEMVR